MSAEKPKKNLAIHLVSGGVAGFSEALACHPLDTIKVRLQLRGSAIKRTAGINNINTNNPVPIAKPPNFIRMGIDISRKEGVLSLYKGLGAVVSGIVPKMAIRFSSFEFFKEKLTGTQTDTSMSVNFVAGLFAGATEAILVVTPMDVLKIRLQSQRHSMTDPLDIPKYRNAAHCAYVMIQEEGVASLYRGVALTAIRQSTNQAANFAVYQYLKGILLKLQPNDNKELPGYQTMLTGLISGACGPLFNAPIDTLKTRIQKAPSAERGWTRFVNMTKHIIKNEGYRAFYKGLTPRILRVAPGQAITFVVYEKVYKAIVDVNKSFRVDETRGILKSENDQY